MTGTKHERICAGCQITDTDPRHVFAVAGGQTPPMPWHMDCHVIATGCEVCAEQLEKAGADLKGPELQEQLIALRDNDTQEG